MEHQNYLTDVRDQYEDLPYPPANPEDEKKQLQFTTLGGLDVINAFCFGGKENFDKGFRVLVAGGGTGDSAIYLAEQLREKPNAEVVYLDLSSASMAIAKQRAAIRQLTNITWVHDSLLELPRLNLGTFDYINCTGVLHHLANPEEGLKALAGVLKPTGAMGIMLYARYGRTGVYQMQELMKLVNTGEASRQTWVGNCRAMLASLPATNWFKRGEALISDHTKMGDAGVFDLLLHTQDRPYSVSETYDFVASAGLTFLDFHSDLGMAKFHYSPASSIKDPALLQKIMRLPASKQHAIAELASGTITKHSFFVAPTPREKLNPAAPENIPFFASHFSSLGNTYADFYAMVSKSTAAKFLVENQGCRLAITRTPHINDILKFLDGQRSTGAILDAVIAEKLQRGEIAPDKQTLLAEFVALFRSLNYFEWLILRAPHVDAFKTTFELQKRVSALYSAT